MTHTRRYTAADLLNDPFFIGFDGIVNRLSQADQNTTNYPPYNIIKTDDNHYSVEVAVAGFTEADIDITVEDGILTIEGRKESAEEQAFLHRGISGRAFKRTFNLADTVVVRGADLTNGILSVDLENVIPEEKRPRKIAIGAAPKGLLTESE